MIVKVKPECKDKDPSISRSRARVVIKPSALQDNMIKLVTANVGKVAR